ncbi:hypothetical protein DPMN_180198 [Dreissena polymorpha]|uniref:Uncharacterized protein n=1 Tax=Dreissena polymorpha TaxID=45954 RepID=A0A9D4IP68_DREPO|nr:hypothetical protein DPMN_180198 [Dreissena polymorpha]
MKYQQSPLFTIIYWCFQVPRLVKVTQADSPYFKIISPHDVGNKVGPGLPTTFRLQFTPDEVKVSVLSLQYPKMSS